MKQFFEEPKVFVERFNVTDQTLTASWMPELGEDEMNPYSVKAIENQ